MSAIFTNSFGQAYRDRKPFLSVIIPTYRRKRALLQGLGALAGQIGVDTRDFEIVVSDDGSGDDTIETVRTWSEAVSVRLTLLVGAQNRGPAHARNRAMAAAAGDVLLITGDDILPPKDFLARHLRWHQSHTDERDALLGPVLWPDDPPPTPFMRWLEKRGRAFYFDFPEAAGEVSSDRFYTCNVSVKRSLVSRCGGFREDFLYASHEDLEMGMRLAEKGSLRLYFEPDLKGVHNHVLTPESSVRRVYLNGYSSVLYWKRVQDHSRRWRRWARWLCRSVAGQMPHRLIWRMASIMPPCGWYAMLLLAYWRGAADAARGSSARIFS